MKHYNLKGSGCFVALFAILIISAVSCKKDWLEIKSDKKKAVPSTIEDFQAILDNAKSVMNFYSPAILGEIASDGHYVSESAWSIATSDKARNAYTWTKKWPYIELSEWNSTYLKIYYCNLALEGLEKIKPVNKAEQQKWNDIKGQALFARAYAYFDLAKIWAPAYNSATVNADLSVPLRLESDITIASVRSTVKQMYDVIFDDLKKAKDLLPVTPLYKTRGSKPAVFSLLSRIYLSIEDYENAHIYADSCLKLYNKLLDYNTLPTANFIGIFNDEVLYHISFASSGYSSFHTTNCLIDTALVSSYHNNDLRKVKFFRQNTNGTYAFRGNYNRNNTELFCGLAVDEIFLIKAECLARAGKATEAMGELNKLMIKRWNNTALFQPYITGDLDVALSNVLNERKKELLMRGIRWSDLRRVNKDERFKITLQRRIGGIDYTLEPNSYKYTFPLPDDIIAQTGMPQNKEW